MTWVVGALTVLFIFAVVLFGGVGGITAVFMIVALAAGVALFRTFTRERPAHR